MTTVARIPSLTRGALALSGLCLLAAVGCSRELTSAASTATPPGQARVAVRFASAVASPAGAPAAPLADEGFGGGEDHHEEFGRVHRADIDSVIVTVTKIEVRVPLPDTENAADSAAEAAKDSAHARGDDDDDDHENDEVGWDSLAIVGNGHLDLVHLPDSAKGGLTVASGSLPPGTYRHVRVFVTGPKIYFKNPIVTPTGDTLKADTGYTVIIPSSDSTGAAMKTDEPFVVPTGGGNVPLFFDEDDTIRHVRVTGDGKIIIPPTIR